MSTNKKLRRGFLKAAVGAITSTALFQKNSNAKEVPVEPSINAESGFFKATGKSAVIRSSQDKLRDQIPSVLDFIPTAQHSAIKNGTTDYDASADFRAMLNETPDKGVIPRGTYHVDAEIPLYTNEVLQFDDGVIVERPSDAIEKTNPVFHLAGAYSGLVGKTPRACRIKTNTASPSGVVAIGNKGIAASPATVTFCQIRNIWLENKTAFGQTNVKDDPDIILYAGGPQFDQKANYYHTINNVVMSGGNIGLLFEGQVNGCTIQNLSGFNIGNTSYGDATLPSHTRNAFLYLWGCVDNTIMGGQFHSSASTTAIILRDHAPIRGSSVKQFWTRFNSISGMIFEPTGSAKEIVDLMDRNSGRGNNFINNVANVSGGNSEQQGFRDDNLYMSAIRNSTNSLRDGYSAIGSQIAWSKHFDLNLAANETFILAEIQLELGESAQIEIDFSNSGAGANHQGAGKVTHLLHRSSAGIISADTQSFYRSGVRPCEIHIINQAAQILFRTDKSRGSQTINLRATIRVITKTRPTWFENPQGTTESEGTKFSGQALAPLKGNDA